MHSAYKYLMFCLPSWAQMNPWVYTLPRGEGKELNLDLLTYKDSNDFFEENNHPGRYEDKKVA